MQIVITVQSLCSPDGLGGQTVIGIARVLYKRGEVLDPVDGALELDLKDRFVNSGLRQSGVQNAGLIARIPAECHAAVGQRFSRQRGQGAQRLSLRGRPS